MHCRLDSVEGTREVIIEWREPMDGGRKVLCTKRTTMPNNKLVSQSAGTQVKTVNNCICEPTAYAAGEEAVEDASLSLPFFAFNHNGRKERSQWKKSQIDALRREARV